MRFLFPFRHWLVCLHWLVCRIQFNTVVSQCSPCSPCSPCSLLQWCDSVSFKWRIMRVKVTFTCSPPWLHQPSLMSSWSSWSPPSGGTGGGGECYYLKTIFLSLVVTQWPSVSFPQGNRGHSGTEYHRGAATSVRSSTWSCISSLDLGKHHPPLEWK